MKRIQASAFILLAILFVSAVGNTRAAAPAVAAAENQDSQPLILADKSHKVAAEGFSLEELNVRLEAVAK